MYFILIYNIIKGLNNKCLCGDTGSACSDPNKFCIDGICKECKFTSDCSGG